MTLATVPRYRGAPRVERSGRAVVLGGSVAGLLAARVLADWFEDVTVVERDALVDAPVARRSVPQGRHPHALHEAGRATLADLLPGYGEELVRAGGVVTDFASDVQFYAEGDYLAHGPVRMETYSASRPLFEQVVRRRVRSLDGVALRTECRFVDYVLDDAGTTVEGVVVRNDDGEAVLPADLVVDATGRTSRTPAWLADHGYPTPPVDEVHVDITYSTTFVERPADDRRVYLVPPEPPRTRGGMAAPVEDDRWVVSVHGIHGDEPPTDFGGLVEYARSLPVAELAQLLDEHPRASGTVESYPFPSNRRYRYEDLDRFPGGLVVVGDAVASFNPVYGQGMSVAALEALVLHDALATGGREDLARRFFDAAGAVVGAAWLLAVGADFRFAQTTGPRPPGTDLVGRYLSRLVRRAHTDGDLTRAFVQVVTMERPPTSLLRPGVAWRVLRPTR
ncbi:FAD-dependent oxidoreductase [Haloarchaeobius sp. HRN-SO-5]|uniref:FAD-dependent oxidoreductase n=1 Tax=Haloarchaeobius sp. HRN-SO-5 TaxID=3446118 RepID=UPI003EBB93A5